MSARLPESLIQGAHAGAPLQVTSISYLAIRPLRKKVIDMRLCPLRRCFFIGMLTGQNNYRITNAVIVRFYRQVSILCIMGLVSDSRQREGEKNMALPT